MKLFEDASVELGHPTPAPVGKQLRVVQLEGVANGRVGAVLARVPLPDLTCHGYQVVQLQEGGTAARSVDQSRNCLWFAPSSSVSFHFCNQRCFEKKVQTKSIIDYICKVGSAVSYQIAFHYKSIAASPRH